MQKRIREDFWRRLDRLWGLARNKLG